MTTREEWLAAGAKSCASCKMLKPYDHPYFKWQCSWKMSEPAPSWLLASWRPTTRGAVQYPDEHWSDRLRPADPSQHGRDCDAFQPSARAELAGDA